MKRKSFGVAAKVGVFVLLFAFLLVPASSSIAQEKVAAAAGAEAGGTGAGAAGAGAAGAGGTAGISSTTVLGIMAGVAVMAGIIAAASSGDDGAATTPEHP